MATRLPNKSVDPSPGRNRRFLTESDRYTKTNPKPRKKKPRKTNGIANHVPSRYRHAFSLSLLPCLGIANGRQLVLFHTVRPLSLKPSKSKGRRAPLTTNDRKVKLQGKYISIKRERSGVGVGDKEVLGGKAQCGESRAETRAGGRSSPR